MKKSTFAMALLTTLVGGSVIGSYVTGSFAEQKFNDYILQSQQALREYSADGFSMEISEVKFQRHFFSSDIAYLFKVKMGNETYVLPTEGTLYHGPFPFNRLTKGKLLPMAASLDSKARLPEQFKDWSAFSDVMQSRVDISYLQNYSGEASVLPLNGKIENNQIEISGIQMAFETDKHFNGRNEMTLPRLVFRGGSPADPMEVTVEKLFFDSEMVKNRTYPKLADMEIELGWDKLSIAGKGNQFIFDKMTSSSKEAVKNDRLMTEGELKTNITMSVKGKTMPLGQLKMETTSDFDASAYQDLQTAFTGVDAMGMLNNEFDKLLLPLLNKQPKLNIKTLSVENEKGKSFLNLNVNLVKPINGISSLKEAVSIFKQSAFKGEIQLASAEDFIQKFMQFEMTEEEAKQLAKLTLAQFKTEMAQSKLMQVSDQAVKFDLAIDNGEVKLNGRVLPEAELEMLLFMLMMGSIK